MAWLEKDIECLEKVQRRLVRTLSNVRGESYEEKLRDAGLTTLKQRRERGDVIEAYKTLNGINNVVKTDWFDIAEPESIRLNTRSNTSVAVNGEQTRRDHVLIHGRAKTEIRNQSYRFRTTRAWCELPDAVKNVTSTNAFKNAYDAWTLKPKPQTESRGIGRTSELIPNR